MTGTSGSGEEVLIGIARINPGKGLVGGISIVFLAIILDRISQSFARNPQTQTTTKKTLNTILILLVYVLVLIQ